jgi:HAMP domain-containing protein
MPQAIALVIAGAGLYAAYRWVSREVERAAEAAERVQADMRARKAERGAKDLGRLEWDETAKVYRPKD